jgi:mgtE-like transporter
MARPARLPRGFPALFGPDVADVRQSLVALALNTCTSLVAGAFLGAITSTFEDLPGLLVLVPAAIGLRGNIFGAFGNRISTSIHAGGFRLSMRRETVLGQNVLGAAVLTLGISLLLAVVVKVIAVALGLANSISFLDLALVSVVGGVLASIPVMAATVGLAAGAVRYDWDLDNVTAPLVSTLGDVLTLPALFLATGLLGYAILTPTLAVLAVVLAAVVLLLGWRVKLPDLRRIVRESVPVLLAAGTLSAMAGVALEKSFESFSRYPALLILVPAQLSSAGALGGILSGRLSSKLLLGVVSPAPMPSREARRDITLVLALAVPVYLFNAVGAEVVGDLLGQASPGLLSMIAAAMVGGAVAMALVVAIAYYAAIAAVRTGLDPDTYGIPIVSSCVDLVGAFALVVAISALGIT